jgi:membrane-bound lytic murein transglycosylase B
VKHTIFHKPYLIGVWCLLLLAAPLAHAEEDAAGFPTWLEGMKTEALSKGISQQTVDEALGHAQFLPKVIELDRKQPESTLTFRNYLKRVVNKKKVAKGRELLVTHKKLLGEISKKYGVQPRFIVALWGIETNYGQNTGGFSVVDSLATMAYEGRRAAFFREELIKALQIMDADHISSANMVGSWAGAMGQTQFMPSSFFNFAVDENGDGKRDIWCTQADVFASIANYLSKSGWHDDLTWGREVKLPKNFDQALENKEFTLEEWHQKGLRRADGGRLSDKPLKAKLIIIPGEEKNAFLVYLNYQVILKWNRSNYFAAAVGELSDAIRY